MDSYSLNSPQRRPLCTSFAPNAHDDVWRGHMSADNNAGSLFGSSSHGGFSSTSSNGGNSSSWFLPPGLHPPLVLPPPPTIRAIFRPPTFCNLDEGLDPSITLEADPHGIDEEEILRSLQEFRNSLPQIRRTNLLGDFSSNYTTNGKNSSNGNGYGAHNPQGRVFRKVRLRRSLDMQKLRPKYRKNRNERKAAKSVPVSPMPKSGGGGGKRAETPMEAKMDWKQQQPQVMEWLEDMNWSAGGSYQNAPAA